jgi:glucose-6-phosphate dehydrogenase-like protein
VPALYNLAAGGLLPDAFAIIGIARREMSNDGCGKPGRLPWEWQSRRFARPQTAGLQSRYDLDFVARLHGSADRRVATNHEHVDRQAREFDPHERADNWFCGLPILKCRPFDRACIWR